MARKRTVNLEHDAIRYVWHDVPEEKYKNCLLVNKREFDSDFRVKGFPYVIQIEPTSMCNMFCSICPAGDPNKLGRAVRHMTLREFKPIVDDMEKYVLFILLWNWGEPLMNPELPEMIKYASDKGIKIVTSTNAHFLSNDEYVKRLLNSGLSTLIVAIDSLEPDKYKSYRTKGNLSIAIKGLENVMKLKRELNSKTRINLRMVIMKQNEHEVSAMKDLARKLKVDIFTVKTVNPAWGIGTDDINLVATNPKYQRFEYKKGSYERTNLHAKCWKAWSLGIILSNGDAIPCGYDYSAKGKVGNVHKEPFTKIWNNRAYRDFRRAIYYEKDSFPRCRDCSINFKLSKAGWFPVFIDFNIGFKHKL